MLPELPEARMETRKPIEVSPKFAAAKSVQSATKQIFRMMAERGHSVNGEAHNC
jgi:hypothetical protein